MILLIVWSIKCHKTVTNGLRSSSQELSISHPSCPVDGGIFILEDAISKETFNHSMTTEWYYNDSQWPFPVKTQHNRASRVRTCRRDWVNPSSVSQTTQNYLEIFIHITAHANSFSLKQPQWSVWVCVLKITQTGQDRQRQLWVYSS